MQIMNHKVTLRYIPPVHSSLLGHYLNSNFRSVFLGCSWQAAPVQLLFPYDFQQKESDLSIKTTWHDRSFTN